ncbi:hypothetical protein [Photobacterium nomapromontoriensis]|uniref:hypothetical protein n=1 Tax=Photobacterium nomapromontoriensis TaxID=2910237 RepID=UPI003D136F90
MTRDFYPEVTHEETYKGYTIFIENNADQYRGGYEFSVLSGDSEIETGIAFTVEDSITEAKDFIDSL